jgi:hypothetical protein
MRVKTTHFVAMLAGFLMCLPASAMAKTITVHPGDSIQQAIDKAHSGDTIKLKAGTYRENVQIKTDSIELRGSGAKSTKIQPAATPSPVCGAGPAFVNGICVADADQNGTPLHTVKDVEISNLTVTGFSGAGVFFLGTSHIEADHLVASKNTEYGIFALNSSKIEFANNTTPDNGEAGIYVGESPQANAEVAHNESTGNNIGIFIRDASFGEVEHNSSSGNCIGILFLNTGAGNGNWKAEDNDVVANDRACPASEEESAVSGVGLAVSGAHDIWVSHNVVRDNKPSGPTDFSGGILVGGTDPNTPPSNVHVTHNVALGNEAVDLLWDRAGTGIVFADNVCKTSDPDGLCKHGQSGGDHHNGDDHGDHHNGGDGHRQDNGSHGKHHKHHHNKHKHHND